MYSGGCDRPAARRADRPPDRQGSALTNAGRRVGAVAGVGAAGFAWAESRKVRSRGGSDRRGRVERRVLRCSLMKLGDRKTIASARMAVAWRKAAADLGVRFVSPFGVKLRGRTYWSSGWLPDFGCPLGAIIAGRHTVDEIFDVCDALGYYASGLNPDYYETYNRERFMETLNDWGWFGSRSRAPTWFSGGFGRHGGAA